MKTLFIALALTLTITSCGKSNSSGGDNTSNGIDSTIRYTQMASTEQEEKIMYDDLEGLALKIMQDKHYYLFKQTRRGLTGLVKGNWYVSGTSIILDNAGTGSYLESTVNGVISDCIYFQYKNLSQELKDYMYRNNSTETRMLNFCRRR